MEWGRVESWYETFLLWLLSPLDGWRFRHFRLRGWLLLLTGKVFARWRPIFLRWSRFWCIVSDIRFFYPNLLYAWRRSQSRCAELLKQWGFSLVVCRPLLQPIDDPALRKIRSKLNKKMLVLNDRRTSYLACCACFVILKEKCGSTFRTQLGHRSQ